MFNATSKNKPDLNHPGDARLKTLLQQWRGIEPSATFEAAVWRRIRVAAAEEPTAPGLWVILRGWLSAEPAWVPAMAATVGLVVGVLTAFSVPQTRTGPYSTAPLLHSQTLSGAYLTMVSGGAK